MASPKILFQSVFLAASSVSNRSVIPKPLNDSNAYTHFAPLIHTTTSLSMQQPSPSIVQSGV
ncbi:unnamed protein product, partial [Rotaria sp. Silwood1]